MGSTETGEMFTQLQVDKMTEEKKEKLGLVPLTLQDQQTMEHMNRAQRRRYLKSVKKLGKKEKK